MDFITLATEHSRLLRSLDEMLGEDADDPAMPSGTVSGGGGGGGGSNTPIGLGASTQNSYGYPIEGASAVSSSSSNMDTIAARPLFSKNAEAELYLLATNFLLYVALVIVVILVCRIYFPEALVSRSRETRPRSYNYRVAEEQEADEEDYASEDEDVGESEKLNENNRTERAPSSFFDFQQESLSRKQVLQRLVFCCCMLNLTFVMWGLLQERMLTRRYPRITGEYFTYSYALVFTNRFWTLIMSGMLMLYLKPRRSQSIVIYEYSFPSISNMLSSWCQYEALRYVSFPATTLFKSFKLAPVMAMGKILGNKSYPQYDYVVALMIGVGIAMFMTSTDDLRFGFDVWGGEVGAAWTGIMLLVIFLFFDSFTSQFQSRMFQRHQDLSMVELMFMTSAFSTVLSFVTLLHTQELYPAMEFVIKHSEIHLHFLLFSICSTI